MIEERRTINFVMEDIFDQTFPQGATTSSAHEHHPAAGDEHAIVNEAGNLPDAAAHDQPLRGKAATQGLTLEEKKERQKLQNRRAAERSRNKKREELTALEMTVNNIQDENNRLRARLSALLASRSAEQLPSTGDQETTIGPSVDYTHLGKLQAELASAKSTLLDREVELARVQGAGDEDSERLRRDVAQQNAALQGMQAEVKTLHSLIRQLRSERDSLARQKDILAREIDARRILRESSGEASSLSTNARAAGVERALLELRGLIDGVIRSWDQTAVLPNSKANDTSV